MDNFVKTLEKTQKLELQKLKQTLTEKKKIALDQMQSEIDSLEEKLTAHKAKQKQLSDQQKSYQKIKTVDFATTTAKDEIAREMLAEIVTDTFKNNTARKKWLESGLKDISGYNKGTVLASDSLTELKKLKTKHSVSKDDSIGSLGFVFSNDSVEVDYTLDNYIDLLFRDNRSEIFELLFS